MCRIVYASVKSEPRATVCSAIRQCYQFLQISELCSSRNYSYTVKFYAMYVDNVAPDQPPAHPCRRIWELQCLVICRIWLYWLISGEDSGYVILHGFVCWSQATLSSYDMWYISPGIVKGLNCADAWSVTTLSAYGNIPYITRQTIAYHHVYTITTTLTMSYWFNGR